MIAPSHGVIWRKNPGKIIQAYVDWAAVYLKEGFYSLRYHVGSTDKMARAIAEHNSEGVEVKMLKLRASDNEAATETLDSKAVIVGPNLNNNVCLFLTVGAFMTY